MAFPLVDTIEDSLKDYLEATILAQLGYAIPVVPTSWPTDAYIDAQITEKGVILLTWGGAFAVAAGEHQFSHAQQWDVVVIEQSVDSTMEHRATYPVLKVCVDALHEPAPVDYYDPGNPSAIEERYILAVSSIRPVEPFKDGYYSAAFSLEMVPVLAYGKS